MKRFIAIIIALSLLMLSGCADSPASSSPSVSESAAPSTDMPGSTSSTTANIVEDNKDYRSAAGKVVMTSAISYERLVSDVVPALAADNINATVATIAANLRLSADLRGAEAINDHKNNADLAAYYEVQEIVLAHVCEKSVSFTIRSTVYSGGMHAQDSDTTLNFDAQTGKQLSFDEIFDVTADIYLPRLHAEILRIIDAEKLTAEPTEFLYYENYAEVLTANFFTDKWYLTDDTLYLIYQPYEIAPYTAGVITFAVPYSAIADILENSQVG